MRSILATLGITACLAACGGYSTQEAYARCEQERSTKQTVDDDAFKQCVACHEDCGLDCEAAGTSPEQYACPP